jgi:phosphoglycolate phosphatase
MVGDRKHDAMGAINNQLRFIGVLYGYGSAQELTRAGARELAQDAASLLTALQRSF